MTNQSGRIPLTPNPSLELTSYARGSPQTLNDMDEIIAGVMGFIIRQTGRAFVWLLSFGRWRGEQLFGDEGSIHSAAGSLSFLRDGGRIITETRLLFFGIAFYVVAFVVVIALQHRLDSRPRGDRLQRRLASNVSH